MAWQCSFLAVLLLAVRVSIATGSAGDDASRCLATTTRSSGCFGSTRVALRALERHELWSTGIPFQLFLWACFCGKPDPTSQIML
jgi:hypothetical protein